MTTQLLDVQLDDKYTLAEGRVFLTGIQALVRLPLMQRDRDMAAGHNTAGFISGYRGSPLGGYDQQLSRARRLLDSHHIVHRPGVNEELAAVACAGSQQAGIEGEGRYDGVFAIWYGKGPGVDRSGDALRHGNLAGSAELGGVLLLLGDDHVAESSTTAHQSEYAMMDHMIPVLNPSGVREILEYGLYGIAMSRYSGAWVALKCIHDTVESTESFAIGEDFGRVRLPEDFEPPTDGLNIRWPDGGLGATQMSLSQERRLHLYKLEAAKAFARANAIDRVVLGDDRAWLGVVSAGKSFADLVQALDDLGIDDARARELGLRVYKPALTWPLEPLMLEQALAGLQTVLVAEEKRPLIEDQIRSLFYATEHRPQVLGKHDEVGAPLFPTHGALSANRIAMELGKRLLARRDDARLRASMARIERFEAAASGLVPAMTRLPYFCSGCPHNTSTRVPEGSKALAGIGCHFMAQWMDRDTRRFTPMGGEGASWVGEAPFSTRPHIFQNLGDGTFYHSGILAVRAAIAAGDNITFKILFNDAVAMTGGQKMETANLDVLRIARLLDAEGVGEMVIVSDEPDKYPLGTILPHGVRIEHRDELDGIQRRMRNLEGVTAIVYDQTCAAEKRRRRKRGEFPDPDERIVINELVCEGCGDCGVQSNCVSIQPVETEFGRKRRIDQSSCNKDYSCVKGFCPSFVSVRGGKLRRRSTDPAAVPFPTLRDPTLPALDAPMGIVVTGIGGTGVITIAALLGMAAHLEGKEFAGLDMIGLAQKGGAVLSHLKIGPPGAHLGSPRVGVGGARLLLGCDIVVAAGSHALGSVKRGQTRAIVNLEQTMTGEFTRDADLAFPMNSLRDAVESAVGGEAVDFVEATRLATQLTGDAIGANLFLVGYAWQEGLVPISLAAIERAIEINGVAVAFNKSAFLWGRRAAQDPAAIAAIVRTGETLPRPAASLDEVIERRVAFLSDYQDAGYAERYRERVNALRKLEASRVPGREELTDTVARYLFKLMAYKDEYEVARLFTDGAFRRQLERDFESWDKLEFHLAPPMLASRDDQGRLRKRRFGPWMQRAFGQLAKLRRLRGTRFDPFGYTPERRMERQLIERYETTLDEIGRVLAPSNYATAVALAQIPEHIRGYGHVKDAHLARARELEASLLSDLRSPYNLAAAAE